MSSAQNASAPGAPIPSLATTKTVVDGVAVFRIPKVAEQRFRWYSQAPHVAAATRGRSPSRPRILGKEIFCVFASILQTHSERKPVFYSTTMNLSSSMASTATVALAPAAAELPRGARRPPPRNLHTKKLSLHPLLQSSESPGATEKTGEKPSARSREAIVC